MASLVHAIALHCGEGHEGTIRARQPKQTLKKFATNYPGACHNLSFIAGAKDFHWISILFAHVDLILVCDAFSLDFFLQK